MPPLAATLRRELPAAALAMIEPLAAPLGAYFHFFGLKGALLAQLGRIDEARVAFDKAIALAHTPAEAAHIRMHLDRLMKDGEIWKNNQKKSTGDVGATRPRTSLG